MIEEKPFLSYDMQIDKLNVKGILCVNDDDEIKLIKSGYYNLVNGYKTPFITGKDENNNHIYLKDTTIKSLYEIKNFDLFLRHIIFRKITSVEEELRTIVGHCFDSINSHNERNWKDIEAYDSRFGEDNITKLITNINSDINVAYSNNNEYIKHYIDTYNDVPTWIMVKVIKFSTFINFIKYSPKDLRISICDLYGIEHKQNDNDFRVLFGSLHWIRKVRNSCAHNERIFQTKCTSNRVITRYHSMLSNSYQNYYDKKRLIDLLIYLKYYLKFDEYTSFLDEIKLNLEVLKARIGVLPFEKVRISVGIKNLNDIDNLTKDFKEIDYKILNKK